MQPDLVFYLQLGVDDLVPRVLEAGKMNYWESGLDMNYGDDLYDSFVAYQTELIQQFNVMSEEFGFHCVDARQEPQGHPTPASPRNDVVFGKLQLSVARVERRGEMRFVPACHF